MRILVIYRQCGFWINTGNNRVWIFTLIVLSWGSSKFIFRVNDLLKLQYKIPYKILPSFERKCFFEVKFNLYFNIVRWNFGLIISFKGAEGLVFAVGGRILFTFRLRLWFSFVFQIFDVDVFDAISGQEFTFFTDLYADTSSNVWFSAVLLEASETLQKHRRRQHRRFGIRN